MSKVDLILAEQASPMDESKYMHIRILEKAAISTAYRLFTHATMPSGTRVLLHLLGIAMFLFVAVTARGEVRSSPSVVVMPFENKSGLEELEWLTLGLQETAITDLQHIHGTDVLDLFQTLDRFPSYPQVPALEYGKSAGLQFVWAGTFRRGSGGKIVVNISVFDISQGRPVAKAEFAALPGLLPGAQSKAIVEIMAKTGKAIGVDNKKMVLARKTDSANAFEQNSRSHFFMWEYSIGNLPPDKAFDLWTNSLKSAVRYDAEYAQAWSNIGWAYYSFGKYEDAWKSFEKATALKPYFIDALGGLGMIASIRDKNYSAAIDYFERALSVNPQVRWVRKELEKTAMVSDDPISIPYILEVLDSGVTFDRLRAIDALKKFDVPLILPHLGPMLKDGDPDVRNAAESALAEMNSPDAVPYIEEAIKSSGFRWSMLELLLSLDTSKAAQYLIGTAKDATSLYRIRAIETLGRIAAFEAIPLLRESVLDEEAVSIAAMRALALMGKRHAAPTLINALRDPRTNVRGVAIVELGELQERSAIPALRNVAETDSDRFIRTQALLSLAGMGDATAIEQVIAIINGSDDALSRFAVGGINASPYFFEDTDLSFAISDEVKK